ncbi:hypothetical protein [Roseovarius sp. 2305UL8-3]|uniref:hypothetical protein n=1 Tax=Roseovarius conchicola TaxID=3121636 RepID=UPI003527B7BA
MVNDLMKRVDKPVLGIRAPASRPTYYAAFCIASAVSAPVAVILWVIEWLWM